MKISPAAEFAVRGVLVLAEQYGQGPVTLNAVCDERHLPKQYLSKLFASLAKADLVTPIRGKRGGYVLTRDPKGITLLEVIEAIEGPLALNYCQHAPSKCGDAQCLIRPVWAALQQAFREKLSSVKLADCLCGNGHAVALNEASGK